MSIEKFEDDRPGCRPATLDMKTGQALPDDHPLMKRALAFWETTTLKGRKVFHDVTCVNSRRPDDLEVVKGLMDRMQAALEE